MENPFRGHAHCFNTYVYGLHNKFINIYFAKATGAMKRTLASSKATDNM